MCVCSFLVNCERNEWTVIQGFTFPLSIASYWYDANMHMFVYFKLDISIRL